MQKQESDYFTELVNHMAKDVLLSAVDIHD